MRTTPLLLFCAGIKLSSGLACHIHGDWQSVCRGHPLLLEGQSEGGFHPPSRVDDATDRRLRQNFWWPPEKTRVAKD